MMSIDEDPPHLMAGPQKEYTQEEKLEAMKRMSSWFYYYATALGCHPFIEFTGVMNEYIKCCRDAHAQGIDFTECNTHSGKHLPMPSYSVAYVNEKLECIFTGRSVVDETAVLSSPDSQTLETEVQEAISLQMARLEKVRTAVLQLPAHKGSPSTVEFAVQQLDHARDNLARALSAFPGIAYETFEEMECPTS